MKQLISIKPASLSHLQTLNELFTQYRQFYDMPDTRQQSLTFLKQRLHNQDSIILLAFIDETAIGFVQIYPAFSSVAMKPLWILNDLFVNKAHRRLGVATQLMRSTEKHAKNNGVFAIKLATQTFNKSARALYEKLDYHLIDQFDHFSKRIE